MKVKIIEKDNHMSLEIALNDYLENMGCSRIRDIKYQTLRYKDGDCYYSAMIIYE